MKRHVPNLMTVGRFFLAIVFFVILGLYDPAAEDMTWVIDLAVAVFLVAVTTDMVDGYLARRMGHLSAFGRIADPFVDKIIVCGALVFLVGKALGSASGWATWMVVVIIARELLVTGMRSFSESHGIAFAATWTGKVKMILQCIAITWSLVYIGHWADAERVIWKVYGRDFFIWATTLWTALSALAYVRRGYTLLKLPHESPESADVPGEPE